MQLEWRVACVRIPRFPIGAVWRAARRGDLGVTDADVEQYLAEHEKDVEQAIRSHGRRGD